MAITSIPSAPGDYWTLLNAGGTTLTGAQTITISNISGKNKIIILVDAASSASASSYIGVQFNGDTGSNCYYYGATLIQPAAYSVTNLRPTNENQGTVYLGAMSGVATSTLSGYLRITGANTPGVKVFNGVGAASASTSNNQVSYNVGGYYNSTSTISSVSIYSLTGNFDAGTVYVYATA